MPIGEATLSWNQNPEADVAGYFIYISNDNSFFSFLMDVPVGSLANPSAPSKLLTAFPYYGLIWFGLFAYDTSSNVSAFSATVSKAIAPKIFPMSWP